MTLFGAWKAAGDAGSRDSIAFGKDAAYAAPEVGGKKYALKHVHLTPVDDLQARALWFQLFSKRKQKTSDRALVYVYCPVRDFFFLIAILDEPNAHSVANMKSVLHRKTMEWFATVADAFLTGEEVIW